MIGRPSSNRPYISWSLNRYSIHAWRVSDDFAAACLRLGAALRERRLSLDLTQEHVAHEADLSVRHYQDLEAGASANPRFKTIFLLAAVLDMKMSDLLEPRRRKAPSRKRATKTASEATKKR